MRPLFALVMWLLAACTGVSPDESSDRVSAASESRATALQDVGACSEEFDPSRGERMLLPQVLDVDVWMEAEGIVVGSVDLIPADASQSTVRAELSLENPTALHGGMFEQVVTTASTASRLTDSAARDSRLLVGANEDGYARVFVAMRDGQAFLVGYCNEWYTETLRNFADTIGSTPVKTLLALAERPDSEVASQLEDFVYGPTAATPSRR